MFAISSTYPSNVTAVGQGITLRIVLEVLLISFLYFLSLLNVGFLMSEFKVQLVRIHSTALHIIYRTFCLVRELSKIGA